MPSAIEELVTHHNVIVTLGAGGVGKTTCSIALALSAAKLGKNVGLLSIDPAKRLADALGIQLGSQLQAIALDVPGTVEAAMLDQKAVFDEMVQRFTKSDKTQDKILNNGVYKAVSEKFGGALEYLALAKLQKMVESGRYDLIVLDTPPDAHALDFLSRPNVLAGFMEHRVMAWLIKPFYLAQKVGLGKLMTVGEKLAGGISEVTGIKALQILAEFLILMQDFIDGLHTAGQRIVKILHSPSTAFVGVTTLKSSPKRSIEAMSLQLKGQGYRWHTMIINRALPKEVLTAAQRINVEHYPDLTLATSAMISALVNAAKFAGSQAADLEQSLKEIFEEVAKIIEIPEQAVELHSAGTMLNFAEKMLVS